MAELTDDDRRLCREAWNAAQTNQSGDRFAPDVLRLVMLVNRLIVPATPASPAATVERVEVKEIERIPLYPLGKGGLRVIMEANGHRFELECHAWPGSEAYVQFERTVANLAAPVGFVAVPVEPTKKMILAGANKLEECTDSGYDSDADGNRHDYTTMQSDTPAQIYRAMLAARSDAGTGTGG